MGKFSWSILYYGPVLEDDEMFEILANAEVSMADLGFTIWDKFFYTIVKCYACE